MQSIDQPLGGKILLVTGGASGIGLALTIQAYALGVRVVVADISITALFSSFAQGKDNILYVHADVTNWVDFTKVFDACEEKWNDVPDAYGICAGVFDPPFSNFWDDPEQDEGYKQVDINVNHPIKLTRLAIRKSLSKGKRASVCIISSLSGISGIITAPLYCATKHAIVGFVKSLKDSEPLTGVKVTTLCPGGVMTPLFDEQKIKQYSIRAQRFLTPEACADRILDLLQEKKFPCGTVLELTPNGERLVPEWNVDPPVGEGTGRELAGDDMIENLMEPVKQALEKDRVG